MKAAPTVTLSIASPGSIAENSGSSLTLTATLSTATTADVTVTFSTGGGATEGTDYQTLSNITISAGATTGTTSFTPIDDNIYEGITEVAQISIDTVSGGSATEDGTQRVSPDISENDSAPSVTLTTSANSIAENAGSSLTLTATSSIVAYEPVTVTISTSGTAIEGTDYSTISDITIAAGSLTGTASFTPSNDSIYELNETAVVEIDTVSIPGGGSATENGDQSVTLTITNDESSPTITLSSNASTIVEDGGGSLTITATSSVATYENITVPISTSGTATEGTDYSAISDITISAGSTTGTASFTPSNDTLYENSETAIIDITVSGGGASESGTQQLTLTITDEALDSGTQATYNSSLASAWQSNTEFSNIEALSSSASSDPSPWESINLHKAWGYGKYGNGETIAIMDDNFSFNCTVLGSSYTHSDISGKATGGVVYQDNAAYGYWSNCANSTNAHGDQVVAAAAAGQTNAGIMGVAGLADVHLSSFSNKGTQTYYPDHWANATDSARTSNAVALNMSWGSDTVLADDIQNYMSDNSVDAAYSVAYHLTNSLSLTANSSSVNTWVTAMNNFQNSGVIIQSLSNLTSEDDADFVAAMPVYFSQLEEAWITAVNIDKTGSSGNYSYTRQSGKCGQTAEYCLGADGWNITLPAYTAGYGSTFVNTAGTSFVAPQIAGAVALLAEHFPNHSPEQLVDRLLASADNSFLTRDGIVTFGNGIQHGYNDEFGHGMMDIYAALNPITSSSLGQSIYTSQTTVGSLSESQNLNSSTLGPSQSFGDSIKRALSNEVNYFYDALNGGFAYKMDGHVIPHSNTKPVINLEAEMNGMKSASTLNNYLNIGKTDYKNILYKKSFSDDEDLEKQLALTLGYSALPVQSFFNFEQMALNGITSYNLPFLDQEDRGLSLNTLIGGDKFKFSLSSTTPIKQSDGEDAAYMGSTTSLLSTMEYTFSEDLALGLLSGFVEEREGFLGLEGNEAFTLDNSSNLSKFNSLKIQKNIKDDLALTLTGTLAYSDFEGDSTSLLKSANNVLSESYSLTLNKADLFGNDNFSISISQPNRVRDGSLTLRLSDLADQDGNINIRETEVDLEPSGRQIDTSFAYTKDISEKFTLSLKGTVTDELNHIKDNDKHYSGYIGLNFENLKIGISDATNISRPSVQLKYRKEF